METGLLLTSSKSYIKLISNIQSLNTEPRQCGLQSAYILICKLTILTCLNSMVSMIDNCLVCRVSYNNTLTYDCMYCILCYYHVLCSILLHNIYVYKVE